MKLYVIYESNKKAINKALKDYSMSIMSWSELLDFQNKSVKRKKDRVTDEVFSLEFDTCLQPVKGKPGLKQCIFVLSEDDIEDIISETFNLLETNTWV